MDEIIMNLLTFLLQIKTYFLVWFVKGEDQDP